MRLNRPLGPDKRERVPLAPLRALRRRRAAGVPEEEVVALPSRAQAAARWRLVCRHFEAFAAARGEDALVWSQMPRLVAIAENFMAVRHRVPGEPDREKVAGWVAAPDHETLRARAQTEVVVGDGCLVVGSPGNMQDAQAPLRSGWRALRAPSADIRPARDRARHLTADAVAVADDLLAATRTSAVELPFNAGFLYRELVTTAWWLGYWEELLAVEPLRVVVVSSGGAPRVRTLLHVAGRHGVPTVFLPHAPQRADVSRTGDLPWDYAGLRGPREVEYLCDHGADRGRLEVIGNPSLTSSPAPAIDPAMPPALAPPRERSAIVAPLLDTVRAALGDDLVVGRHPGADDPEPEGFSPGWRIWAGRTYDLLRAGPPAVIQHSSGITIEALHLGLPVIELHFPDRPPIYPFTSEPHVQFASDSRQLRDAVAAAREQARDPQRRQELIEWSRGWASPTGSEAAERTVGLVERALDEGPRGRILDTWSSPTPA